MKKLTVFLFSLLALSGSAWAQLGSLTADVVFTPVPPCRIVDTRVFGGPIAADGGRSFVAVNANSFASQGGAASNCGTLGLSATAVAVNVTAVAPEAAGWTIVYPFGTVQPTASSINYAAGAVVNNALTVQVPNPFAIRDFTIFSKARSHYVVDIVGYFAPPVATALQCATITGATTQIPANSSGTALAPACSAGYTQTSLNCDTFSFFLSLSGQRANTRECYFRNTTAGPLGAEASVTCCRIPGR